VHLTPEPNPPGGAAPLGAAAGASKCMTLSYSSRNLQAAFNLCLFGVEVAHGLSLRCLCVQLLKRLRPLSSPRQRGGSDDR
jgi:hypothetical protein